MRDIVANRSKLRATDKIHILRHVLRENGLLWTSLFGAYYVLSSAADQTFNRLARVRLRRSIPGLNSESLNREIWNRWNWGEQGEEWTVSEEWKRELFRRATGRYLRSGAKVLEIGPGGGRWTEALLGVAESLIGVDLSETCVEHCRARFAGNPKASFAVTSGSSLSGIDDGSIDFVWSFDVFVHINREDVERYLFEITRVLAPGGVAVIHHGTEGGVHGGWRSNLTAVDFDRSAELAGLELVERFATWTEGETRFDVGKPGDVITALRARGPSS